MVNKCPHCGSIVEKPIIFSRCLQRVFNFIWDHPRCTREEIEAGVYGKYIISNVVYVSISKIRNRLKGTSYRLVHSNKRYDIIDVSMPSTTKESVNASV